MEDAEMKKQIVTGLIGAASLLAMAATGAYALGDTCASGTVTDVQAGYVDADMWANGCIGAVYITCDGTAPATDDPNTAGVTSTSKKYCVHSALYADGVMATALTAMVESKKVSSNTYSATGFGDGLILSLTVLGGE
jgi:hypothetical protein